MKKIIYSFGIIAASAFVFSACEKEQATQDEVRSEGKLVTISFTAEKAGLETKTAAVEGATDVSYIWTTEDIANIKLFTVEGGSLASEVDSPVITKVSDTKLTISATVAANATYTFRAILCDPSSYTSSGDDYTARKPKIKTNQSPNGTSNYDPTADILVSDDKEVTVGEEETTTGDMLLTFRRQVVVNKMTLKNMVEGEKVSKVVISSDKYLTGYLNEGAMSGQSKALILTFDKVAVPEGGQFPVYFITMPNEEQTLSVEVTTDQFIYSKDFSKTIDFNLGEFTKFSVALPAGTANGVLSLPFSDDFSWNTSGATLPSDKYSASSTLYTDKGNLRLGTGSVTGYITTKEIDLSSAFYVKVNAFAYNASSDKARIQVKVDDETAQDAVNDASNMTADAKDYYFNFAAATSSSKVTITVSGTNPRFALNSIEIQNGAYVLPPVINVTSDNPMSVANTASSQTIEYTIANPTAATLTAALQAPADWISNIDYSTDGEVTFDVAAQSAGDPARSAVIVLSYTGAPDVEVKVNQAAGAGGTTTKTFTIASADVVTNSGYAAYNTTVNTRDWVITFGGNNKSVGTNSGSRTKCTLSSYSKYAVSPVTTSSIASAFASKTSLSNVSKVSYTFSGGSNQTNTNVYLLYSSDNTTFSQITLTKGTQGAAISSGTEFEFDECSGYFAVLFVATNSSGNWRIDDVNLTFTYTE